MPGPLLVLLPIAVGAATGGAKLWEGKQAKKSAEAQAEYARGLAEAKEMALRRQAKAEEYRRRQQASSMSDAATRNRAAMEARYAKGGVTLSGSVAVALATQAAYDEQNVQAMNVASFYQQKALRREARNAEMAGIQKAEEFREAGKAAMRQAYVSAATSVAGGVAGGFAGATGLGGAIGKLAGGLEKAGGVAELFMSGETQVKGEDGKAGTMEGLAQGGLKDLIGVAPMFLNLLTGKPAAASAGAAGG